MYRHQQQQQHVGADADAYVEVNSDVETGADASPVAGEMIGSELDELQHLHKDMFAKAQKALIDIDITASPAELQSSGASNVWKLLPHLSKELKQNLALKNRNAASGDQLAGNLNRCIPLNLEIVQQKNSFPYPMGIKIPGMMDANLHRNGQCVWRVPPDTQTMMVGKAVFEPTNIVNKYMYNNYRMCTLEDLNNDVKFFAKTS